MDSVRIKSLCAFLYTQLFRACGAERRQSSNHGGDLPVAWRFLVKFRDSLDKITSQIPLMKYESPFPLWNSFLKALKSILIGICSRALWKYRLSLQIFFWMKAHFMVSVMENEFVFLHPLKHVSWGLSRAKWWGGSAEQAWRASWARLLLVMSTLGFLCGGQQMNLAFRMTGLGFRSWLGHLFIVRPEELDQSQFFICRWGTHAGLLEQPNLRGSVVLCSSLWHCPYKVHAVVTLLGPSHFLVAFSSTASGRKSLWSSGVTWWLCLCPIFSFYSQGALSCLISFDH